MTPQQRDPDADAEFVFGLERPMPKLLTVYLLRCLPALLFPPVGIVLMLVHLFRYQTLRYRFDSEGIFMRWGILFRHEIILNYARVQDIRLESGLIERWFGLARIQLQTASGSSTPEMTLEGLPDHERIRDFLYSRMRGTRDLPSARAATPAPTGPAAELALPAGSAGELATVLREAAEELRAIRVQLEQERRG